MCIIASLPIQGEICLVKVRDRNYTPRMYVFQKRVKGVEILFYVDAETSWVEGINEYGICIVNSALMVKSDEKEQVQRDTKAKGSRASKDGVRATYILTSKTLEEALARYYEGSPLKGHTLLTDGKKIYHLEAVSDKKPQQEEVDPSKPFVCTNHGLLYPEMGYHPETLSGKSSRARRHQALKLFEAGKIKKTSELAQALLDARLHPDKRYSFDMVRDTNLKTSSIAVFCPQAKSLDLALIKDKILLERDLCDKDCEATQKNIYWVA